MKPYLFRCSSIGKLMTSAVSIGEEFRTPEVQAIIDSKKRTDEEKFLLSTLQAKTLSIGAKTYIRELAAQEIFGIDFEVGSKQMEKGIEVEGESIALMNRVRGLNLQKNTERRTNAFISGECDVFNAPIKMGHDVKSSWSAGTFPITVADCEDSLYEWQMRGYMALWDADKWSVDYCLVDTPDRLIGFEPMQMHMVSHIPEHMRITSWVVTRDLAKETAMYAKIIEARKYFEQVIAEFEATHGTDFFKALKAA